MTLSIIIPTFNEENNIGGLLAYLEKNNRSEILEVLIIDGGSTDNTAKICQSYNCKFVVSPEKGRGAQMNYGASIAKGDVFYFVHADVFPPATFVKDILQSIQQQYFIGTYISKFNSKHPLLKINAALTKMDKLWCRGGDQTLFVTRQVFQALGGFCMKHVIMEDYDIIIRARKKYKFKIIKKPVLISTRKYQENSYLRVQIANFIVFTMYRFGTSPKRLQNIYRALLK